MQEDVIRTGRDNHWYTCGRGEADRGTVRHNVMGKLETGFGHRATKVRP